MSTNAASEREPDRSDAGLAFFGRVTASVSHELNNVISIIDQTAGLLEDLIAGEERGIPITTERLSQAAASIKKQTDRGLHIIQRLNRFAHSADYPVVEFDVNEVMENLVALTRRLADLKRAGLELKSCPTQLQVTGNPFLLQQAIFAVIGLGLGSVERDDVIEVVIEGDGGGSTITVTCPREINTDDNTFVALHQVADRLQGNLSVNNEAGKTEFRLYIPKCPLDAGC